MYIEVLIAALYLFSKVLKYYNLLIEVVRFVSVAFGPNWAKRWKNVSLTLYLSVCCIVFSNNA